MSEKFAAVEIISAKRDKQELSNEQIDWTVDAYTRGVIADEQMSALLMAILLNGMNNQEISRWTDAMIASGERMNWSMLDRPTVDKHSTGGVGDKITLPLAPLVAACGAAVPQLSGRGLGHETIHRFLFFDPSISTYTLPGIQKGVKYQVSINKGFFDNINITTDTAFTNVEEAPFVKYDGKIFDNDGDTFTGGDVSVYEIKYPNFVTVYKVVEDINKSFPVLGPKDKGEEGGVDPSVTEKEDVNASGFDLFKAAILEQYRGLSESIISWIPKGQSAFWLDSNYSDDWWVVDKADNAQTLTIATDTNKTITFTKCEIKKTGLKTILFEFAYFYYSALQTVKQIPDSQKLVIGLDSDLNPDQIKEIKRRLGAERAANDKDTLFPEKEIQIGGFTVDSLFPIEGAKDNQITSSIVEKSEFNVNITISKIKNMPDISFEDFSKSSVIQIINRK